MRSDEQLARYRKKEKEKNRLQKILQKTHAFHFHLSLRACKIVCEIVCFSGLKINNANA